MSGNEPGGENFEEMLRSLAAELGRYIERSVDGVDLDDFAGSFGVDPLAAREWFESAGGWLSSQTENLGEQLARRARGPERPAERIDPLGGAAPHPLDQPSDEQGTALAALDSGRWIIEPGTDALAARGEGPTPSNALGIVRELRVRDWIAADGRLTATGRHALGRWLEASTSR